MTRRKSVLHMKITLYHYSGCSKSRAVATLLENPAYEVTVRHYQDEPLSKAELQELMGQLGISDPLLMMRSKDALFSEMGLDQAGVSGEALLDALAAAPKLLERPIVVIDGVGKIGRPPEVIAEWLVELSA